MGNMNIHYFKLTRGETEIERERVKDTLREGKKEQMKESESHLAESHAALIERG